MQHEMRRGLSLTLTLALPVNQQLLYPQVSCCYCLICVHSVDDPLTSPSVSLG